MWITNTQGFYSIVEHRDGPEFVLVRCRTQEDAQAFADFCGFLPEAVMDDPSADYRWRVKAKRSDVEEFAAQSIRKIDYKTSVKDALDKNDPKRHSALLRCWQAMMTLQEGGAYGSLTRGIADAEAGMLTEDVEWDREQSIPDTPEQIELIEELKAVVKRITEVRPDDCYDLIYDQLDIIYEELEGDDA